MLNNLNQNTNNISETVESSAESMSKEAVWTFGLPKKERKLPRFYKEAVLSLLPVADSSRAKYTMSLSKTAIEQMGLDLSNSTKDNQVCIDIATSGERTAIVANSGTYWVKKKGTVSNKELYNFLVNRYNLDSSVENNFSLVDLGNGIFSLTAYEVEVENNKNLGVVENNVENEVVNNMNEANAPVDTETEGFLY